MSNYGHNYGSLEEYAREKAEQSDRDFAKLKEVFAIVRVKDRLYLTKSGDLYTDFVDETTYLTKKVGVAFDKISEVESKDNSQLLKVHRVFITRELYDKL